MPLHPFMVLHNRGGHPIVKNQKEFFSITNFLTMGLGHDFKHSSNAKIEAKATLLSFLSSITFVLASNMKILVVFFVKGPSSSIYVFVDVQMLLFSYTQ